MNGERAMNQKTEQQKLSNLDNREKRNYIYIKKNEQSFMNLWNKNKRSNIHVIR